MRDSTIDDELGALCRHTHAALRGSGVGPLAGLTFAVKDVFDIAGYATGAGSPEWLRTHGFAERTAPAVQSLLDAGADMVGKTHTDELAYSLNGQNIHYGTPVNPRAPRRIPGGSSSGSAAVVAGGVVDFALGTDCGGSVRLPASYCGILGYRPTHGRIPLEGIVPLASSFDTVGWFARDATGLEAVGRVLLGDDMPAERPNRLLCAVDMFSLVPTATAEALTDAVAAVTRVIGSATEAAVLNGTEGIDCLRVFRILQGGEAWANHGAWIRQARPAFGPGVMERFEAASKVTQAEIDVARGERAVIAAKLDSVLQAGTVICLPTAPGAAPLSETPLAELEAYRATALRLLSLAGLAGLPQLSLPLGTLESCPLGLSLIARRGADTMLFGLARALLG